MVRGGRRNVLCGWRDISRIEGTGGGLFNDAWALRVSDGEWTGVPVAEGEGFGGTPTGYRWHVPDPVPFREVVDGWDRAFRMDLQCRWICPVRFRRKIRFLFERSFLVPARRQRRSCRASYGSARLPLGTAAQTEVEQDLSKVSAEAGSVSVQKEVFLVEGPVISECPRARVKVKRGF